MGQQEILIDFGKGISSRIRAYCKDFPYPGGGSLWEVGLVGSHSGPRGPGWTLVKKSDMWMFHVKQDH